MRFSQFGSMLPKKDPATLQEGLSALAVNTEGYRGTLRAINYPEPIEKLVDIYGKPFKGVAANISVIGSVWVGWSAYTHTAPDFSRRLGDTTTLFVMNGELYRQSAERILAGRPPIKVGITRPVADGEYGLKAEVLDEQGCPREEYPLDCVPSNDSACDKSAFPPEATAYAFTYVNGCQEESAPSKPSNLVDFDQGDAIKLTFTDTPPANAVIRRVYRAVSTEEGKALFLYVGEVSASATEYYDLACMDNLGGELQTTTHDAPPDCIDGVAVLGDNVTVVWGGKRFFTSEPNLPHAYDISQEYKLRFQIISMVSVTDEVEGNDTYRLLTLCKGLNYIINAHQDAGTVSISEVQTRHFAYDKHSIAKTESGVVFVCRQGICSFTTNGTTLLTADMMTEVEWGRYYPAQKHICYYDDQLYTVGEGRNIRFVLGTDKRREPYLSEHTIQAETVFCDELDRIGFAFKGQVYSFTNTGRKMRYVWRSPTITLAGEWRPTFIKVISDEYLSLSPDVKSAMIKYNQWARYHTGMTLEDFIQEHPELAAYYNNLMDDVPSVEVVLLADNKEYYRVNVRTGEPVRVPRKHKAFDWAIELSGSLEVREVHVQTSRETLLGGD